MVILTRLNGNAFALNPDLIERAESTPDTIVTLVDGTKYIVRESIDELIAAVRNYRSSVVAAAGAFDREARDCDFDSDADSDSNSAGTVLQLHRDS
jgi:flagellar protein FlbD